MAFRLFVLILLLGISPLASAEYYLVYQRPSFNFTNHLANSHHSTHSHYYPASHRLRHSKNSVVVEVRRDQPYGCVSCGCTPETCMVPKREIYVSSGTTCVTYEDVMAGYQ